jgi:hypothetical protein
MFSEKPAITEPATKITMLSWTRSFLSKRSASLPQMGVVAAFARSAAVMTHAKSVWVPLSSDMMVGRAFATMVLLRIAVKKAASSPVRASMICRWFIGAPGSWRLDCRDACFPVRARSCGAVAVTLAIKGLLQGFDFIGGAGRRCPG